MKSQLAPSASEFVPSGSSKRSNYLENEMGRIVPSVSSMSGMNSSASEWVPQDQWHSAYPGDYNEKSVEDEYAPDYSDYGQQQDQMVEVNWNGSVFFVPQDNAHNSVPYDGQDNILVPEEVLEHEKNDVLPEDHPLLTMKSATSTILAGMEYGNTTTTLPAPPKRSLQTIGIPEPVREHFQSLDMIALRQMDPADPRYKEIPLRYHSAMPLDVPNNSSNGQQGSSQTPVSTHMHMNSSSSSGLGGSFGYPSSVYKVVDRADSQMYALRRFDNVRNCPPVVVANALSKWADLRHPAVVSLYGIHSDKDRGGALFFSFAYHPGALTLKQRFVDQRGGLLNETLIWRVLDSNWLFVAN
mmetsp:Transcript_31158/g.44780  ORF Transcript_31158/g.44780 Transcript_31158/m.44780 type:complete len:355 (+) Transcript_31158:32-1096(+)